jgi:general secretion pathway protein M
LHAEAPIAQGDAVSDGVETEGSEAEPGRAQVARAWWRSLAVREKRLFLAGATVLGLYLAWAVAVQPAWRTIARASAERDALETQWQTMQRLAEEAQQLRAAPRVSQPQAVAALEAATARLGPAGRLALQGDRAVLTLNGVEPRQLREWLAEVRAGARARPVEATLQRGAQGFTGSLVVQLGAAP